MLQGCGEGRLTATGKVVANGAAAVVLLGVFVWLSLLPVDGVQLPRSRQPSEPPGLD